MLVLRQSQAGFDAAATGYTWDKIEAATSPLDEGLPVPASWMDASDASTLVTSNGDTQVCLLEWKDVRGEGYPYAYAAGTNRFAEVVTNSTGRPHHIYFKSESTTKQAETHSLIYSPAVNNVKAVFKVWNGSGSMIYAQDYNFMTDWAGYTQRIFYNSGHGDMAGTFYVNGEIRQQVMGQPYNASLATVDKTRFDPEVSEFHFSSSTYLPHAQRHGYYSGGSGTGRNGREERACEILLYTNALTFVQRQKICAYLMKKWMHGAEPNQDYGTITNKFVGVLDADKTMSYPVAEGSSAVVQAATGSVSLVKSGPGTLYVNDLANAAGGLRVSGGTLRLNSPLLAGDTVPGCPYLHIDASDTNTIALADGSETSVAAWRDVRGAGHPTATVITEGKYPTLVADGLNGKSVVNYPGMKGSSQIADVTGFAIPETDRLYAVFKVLGGVGGGVISGYSGVNGNPVVWGSGGEMHTVNKTLGGSAAGYNWFNDNKNYAIGQGRTYLPNPGGTTFRINGVDCNPTTTAHASGDVELLAYNGYDHIWTDSIGCCYGERNYTNWKVEDGYNGEVILYTNTLSRASALKVEAYLNKKWFGKDTPGCRAATTGRLVVDEGATLAIDGGAPVTASAFACAGSVSGTVSLAEGATLELVVGEDGTVSPLDVSGGIDFSRGGTVALSGGKLRTGAYPLAANAGAGLGAWTLTGLSRGRDAVLVEAGGVVSLVVYGGGIIIIR